MSTHNTQEATFKGFIKNWWNGNKLCGGFHHSRQSPANKPFARFVGRHKRLGASRGCHCKQFDNRSHMVFRNFNSRTYIPWDFQMPTTVWRFGRKDGMHIRNKFLYK